MHRTERTDDRFKTVFWKDQVLFFLDENTKEQIFDFAPYVDWPNCQSFRRIACAEKFFLFLCHTDAEALSN